MPDIVVAYSSTCRLTPYILRLCCPNPPVASSVNCRLWEARSQRSFNATSTNHQLNDVSCEVSYVSRCIVGTELDRQGLKTQYLTVKGVYTRDLHSHAWASTSQVYPNRQRGTNTVCRPPHSMMGQNFVNNSNTPNHYHHFTGR